LVLALVSSPENGKVLPDFGYDPPPPIRFQTFIGEMQYTIKKASKVTAEERKTT
jgi:hypothetical protein